MNLQNLRKQPHLSASAINDYVECGQSYRFGRIERATAEFTPAALALGSCIHKALEQFYLMKQDGKRMSLEDLQEAFEVPWHDVKHIDPPLQYKPGEDFNALLIQGKSLLASFQRNCPNDPFQVLATEQAFSFQVEGVELPIIGAIDLLEQDDQGNLIITDFKTSGRAYSREEIDRNLQLTIYYMAARQMGFEPERILLKFDCLIKTRVPRFEQYYTMRGPEDEERAAKKVRVVWAAIQQGVFVPNDASWKCSGCVFKQRCDAWFAGKEAA